MPGLAHDAIPQTVRSAEPTTENDDEPPASGAPAPRAAPAAGTAADTATDNRPAPARGDGHDRRAAGTPAVRETSAATAAEGCGPIEVTVDIEFGAVPPSGPAIDSTWIAGRLRAVRDHVEEPAPRRIAVRLVGDARMRTLHRQHCGLDSTTDVLTYPDDGDGVDIVACVDEARRRSAEFGHPVERELLLYAVHGLLHTAGHDDHEETARDAMHAEEDRLLALVGVGRTFDAANRETSTRWA